VEEMDGMRVARLRLFLTPPAASFETGKERRHP
jgi:hypothetical protein